MLVVAEHEETPGRTVLDYCERPSSLTATNGVGDEIEQKRECVKGNAT